METKGVPLDFILSSLPKEEYVIDWLDFILTSVQHNWKLRGTMKKIENSMNDVYGRVYSLPVIEELQKRCKPFTDDL